MPRKIRELMRDLERAGFRNIGGKGSHRNYVLPEKGLRLTLSGKAADDALPYQEKLVKQALKDSSR